VAIAPVGGTTHALDRASAVVAASSLPVIIQGGMGVAVSGWQLARAVSSHGQLGVVSGTAVDAVMVRRLQLGDPGGDVRRALDAFPIPEAAARILDRYFIAGGKGSDTRFRAKPMIKVAPSRHVLDLVVVANFVEVFLAKEGHTGAVGINYLEKIQTPTLASLYGAMLAGVDCVLVGAGIPRAIPGILDGLAAGEKVRLRLDVKGSSAESEVVSEFDPSVYATGVLPRPLFLAIVSSHVLATMLARNAESSVDGFVIEAPTAGGHNAPPRAKGALTDTGEPLYGERDEVDLEAIRSLGRPFWLAGSRAEPTAIAAAIEAGATGVQVGTAFAYCDESGLDSTLKRQVIDASRQGRVRIFTDPVASPTGFPFKVVQMEDTLSDDGVYADRDRVCDLGYLRVAYIRDDQSVGWRCPAEPIDDYVAKGGAEEDTIGRKCLCNSLMAAVGLGQLRRSGLEEPMLLTAGDDVADVARFLPPGADTYGAADVINYLLAD